MQNETFRLNARNVYLTYPQCPIEMQDMLQQLTEIKPYVHHCICRERHEDGNYHLHVLLKYEKAINIRSQQYYDIRGYHPNIQSARDTKAVLTYIRKDGMFQENWPDKRSYMEIMDQAETQEQFLQLIKSNQPKDYILHLEKIEYAAQRMYARPASPYKPQDEQPWNLPDDIMKWMSNEFIKADRPRSLWLCGPTRTGKTQWARSLGIHNYWNGMSCLDTFSESASYLVIDDIEWQYVTSKKQLFGAQKEFVATDKYRKKRTIKWGKPCIYLFNPDQDPWDSLKHSEKEWYEENCTRVYINNKLY